MNERKKASCDAARLARRAARPWCSRSRANRCRRRHHARSSLLHPAATPLGSLTPAEAPLIDAENLFRQPGPPLDSAGPFIVSILLALLFSLFRLTLTRMLWKVPTLSVILKAVPRRRNSNRPANPHVGVGVQVVNRRGKH